MFLFCKLPFAFSQMIVSTQKLFSITRGHIEKVLSCANEFKPIPHFLIYQIPGIWASVEILDPFEIELCVE